MFFSSDINGCFKIFKKSQFTDLFDISLNRLVLIIIYLVRSLLFFNQLILLALLCEFLNYWDWIELFCEIEIYLNWFHFFIQGSAVARRLVPFGVSNIVYNSRSEKPEGLYHNEISKVNTIYAKISFRFIEILFLKILL